MPVMSTLTEIEEAVATLSHRDQRRLVQHLSLKLRVPPAAASTGRRKRWPVPPPTVSKMESQRIARRVEVAFGRVFILRRVGW